MIGIRTSDITSIHRLLPSAGISPSSVVFNPPTEDGLSCLIHVGGPGVFQNHCYVQRSRIPYIQCLDPRETFVKPENLSFILCALQKAVHIDRGEALEQSAEEIIIGDTLGKIIDFDRDFRTEATLLSIDIELRPDIQEMTCIGFAYKTLTSCYRAISIPFERSGQSIWPQELEEDLWLRIAEMCATSIPKLMQNFIFDSMYLSKFGIEVRGPIMDTMVLAHLLNPEMPKGLKDLARLYLMCEPWKDIKSWDSTEELWRYNALDALRTLQIYESMYAALEGSPEKLSLWNNQLVPLHEEVLRMCERGWTVDHDAIATLATKLRNELMPLTAELRTELTPLLLPHVEYVHRKLRIKPGVSYYRGKGSRMTTKKIQFTSYEPFPIPEGLTSFKKLPPDVMIFEKVVEERSFNPLSQDDVMDALVARGHKIPTFKGKETVDERALLRLYEKTKEPMIPKVLRCRELSKLLGTYATVELDPDKKLRFSINIAGTVEGRFSSKQTPWGTGLNIQNLPKNFRHICIPSSPDMVILNLDFKAADPHMVGYLAAEKDMLRILQQPGGDLHSFTAAKMLGKPIESIAKDGEERQFGKCANNGLNYGMGPSKFMTEIAFKTGIYVSLEKATDLYNRYHAAYPGIKAWHESVRQQLLTTRTLTTPFGRTRFFHGNFRDPYVFEKVLKSALAWVPPTTVADALNCGWLRFKALADEAHLRYNILQQCHDSLMMEVSHEDLEAAKVCLRRAFESVIFTVNMVARNLPISLSWGPNAGNLTEIS